MALQLRKYRASRYWAIYEDEELLCVTVYKRGAAAVIDQIRHGTLRREGAATLPTSGRPGTNPDEARPRCGS